MQTQPKAGGVYSLTADHLSVPSKLFLQWGSDVIQSILLMTWIIILPAVRTGSSIDYEIFCTMSPMLIASVSKILPALAEYEAPSFEGMKNVFLPPVDEKMERNGS